MHCAAKADLNIKLPSSISVNIQDGVGSGRIDPQKWITSINIFNQLRILIASLKTERYGHIFGYILLSSWQKG
jgi:hypothetical protein